MVNNTHARNLPYIRSHVHICQDDDLFACLTYKVITVLNAADMARELREPAKERIPGIFLGSRARLVRKAGNLTAVCKPVV
jgi:hypothetical protein